MVYDYKEKFSVQGKKCIVTGGAQGYLILSVVKIPTVFSAALLLTISS